MNIVITGASKGLGFAIADRYASDKQGHTLLLCARDKHELQLAARNLQARYPRTTIFFFACDVSKKSGITEFTNWILQTVNTIDVLVNNAAAFAMGSLLEEEESVLEKMMEANVYSAYYLTRNLLPEIKKENKGHIFNISSIAALQPSAHIFSYSISKHALTGFSRNLREELKTTNIKVTTVFPGAFLNSTRDRREANQVMEAADIANMIYAATYLSPKACVEEIVLRPQGGDV